MVELYYLKIVRAGAQLNATTKPETIGISTVRQRMRRVDRTRPATAAGSVTCRPDMAAPVPIRIIYNPRDTLGQNRVLTLSLPLGSHAEFRQNDPMHANLIRCCPVRQCRPSGVLLSLFSYCCAASGVSHAGCSRRVDSSRGLTLRCACRYGLLAHHDLVIKPS